MEVKNCHFPLSHQNMHHQEVFYRIEPVCNSFGQELLRVGVCEILTSQILSSFMSCMFGSAILHSSVWLGCARMCLVSFCLQKSSQGHALGNFLHLVIPALVRLCDEERADDVSDNSIRERSIRALGELSTALHYPHLLSRIVHPLLRISCTSRGCQMTVIATDSSLRLGRFFVLELCHGSPYVSFC